MSIVRQYYFVFGFTEAFVENTFEVWCYSGETYPNSFKRNGGCNDSMLCLKLCDRI